MYFLFMVHWWVADLKILRVGLPQVSQSLVLVLFLPVTYFIALFITSHNFLERLQLVKGEEVSLGVRTG